jgi:4-amino-4-deoxy-L-arabinose transferase-like glycosyltransferase
VTRTFAVRLGLVVLAGLGLRLAFALHYGPHLQVGGDAFTYHLLANYLADGRGFVDAQVFFFTGVARPTAEHPPLYPLLLSVSSLLGGDSFGAHRVASCLMGTGTVAAVGFLGRRVAGERAGLLAAALAAAYPILVLTDASIYSESLYGLAIALALIAAYRYLDRPTPARALMLGGAIGLAALTRSEAILLLVLLAAPVARRAGERRLARFGLAALACAVLVAPWTIRSSLALDSPVLLSTNLGGLVAGANCHSTYHGQNIGQWRFACFGKLPRFDNQADLAAFLRRRGTRYARHHLGRLPIVAAVRVGRVWEVYRPLQNANYEATIEGRHRNASRVGLGFYYLLVPLALFGLVLLRRRGRALVVLLAPVLLVTITAAISYGVTRFRIPADVSLVVLAGVGVDGLLENLGRRRSEASASRGPRSFSASSGRSTT